MESKPYDDLFAHLEDGQLPIPYLFIARIKRSALPELSKRDRQAAFAPRHKCNNLPIIGPDVLSNSVWWEGDKAD